MKTLSDSAARLAKTHPRSLPSPLYAVGAQGWAEVRRLQARDRRLVLFKHVAVVLASVAVYSAAIWLALGHI